MDVDGEEEEEEEQQQRQQPQPQIGAEGEGDEEEEGEEEEDPRLRPLPVVPAAVEIYSLEEGKVVIDRVMHLLEDDYVRSVLAPRPCVANLQSIQCQKEAPGMLELLVRARQDLNWTVPKMRFLRRIVRFDRLLSKTFEDVVPSFIDNPDEMTARGRLRRYGTRILMRGARTGGPMLGLAQDVFGEMCGVLEDLVTGALPRASAADRLGRLEYYVDRVRRHRLIPMP